MAVTDRSVTSRTVAPHIESVKHHSVSVRAIRHRLQYILLTARHPFLGLPLTENHRFLRHQWRHERRMWAAEWIEVVSTNEPCICLQNHDGQIRVWRHPGERMLKICVMHRHTAPEPLFVVLGGSGYHFRTPLIEMLPRPAHSPNVSPIENMWFMVAQRLTQITSPVATPDQFWQRVEDTWSAVPPEHI
ncbi:transposable element Tcb1 transposase [Trichonephila clavipes]|nr:transposable element Tcb1 transposase [Trichonephila clavipes]